MHSGREYAWEGELWQSRRVAINNWWDGDPDEHFWLEIRQEPIGLGEYLRAPKLAGNGKPSWSYELVTFVQPGDRVFHWHRTDSGEPGIVGWSIAEGPLETMTWSWMARGTRGRERGVPTVGPTWNMPLGGYTPLAVPLTRSAVNARRDAALQTMDGLTHEHGKRIYAPFQNYGGRELRAQQGYLTKFPAALVALFFDAPDANESVPGRQQTPRAVRGQGYQSDAQRRVAVERHALSLAIAHYRARGAVEIEELGKPYDLRVVVDGRERHVEVKGASGCGVDSVQLTQGEVEHARGYQPTDLFVVDGIVIERSSDGAEPIASGGSVRLWADWSPTDGALRPTHLRYKLSD